MNTYEARTKAKTIAAIVTIVVIVGIVILIETLQKHSDAATSSLGTTDTSTPAATDTTGTTSSPTTSNGTSSTTSSSTYKDGTYTADQQYYVPHGYEDIKVTITVASGVVTNASIVNSENDRDSQRYQEDFASSYKNYVVGKKLSDVKLSYVAGASDTTQAFDDALAQVRTQAQG